MPELILFLFAAVGLTFIIVDGVIFQPARNYLKSTLPAGLYKLFDCYQCSGMWCGVICGLILISYNPFVLFCCGCAASFASVWMAALMNYVEAKSVVELGESDRA